MFCSFNRAANRAAVSARPLAPAAIADAMAGFSARARASALPLGCLTPPLSASICIIVPPGIVVQSIAIARFDCFIALATSPVTWACANCRSVCFDLQDIVHDGKPKFTRGVIILHTGWHHLLDGHASRGGG